MKNYIFIFFIFLFFSSYAKIHYRLINDTVQFKQIFNLDVNQDGNIDYQFALDSTALYENWCTIDGLGQNLILDNSTHGYPDALNYGALISTNSWTTSGTLGTFSGAGHFDGAGIKFLGIELNISNNYVKGWIRLVLNANCTKLVIIDLAYMDSPNDTITAGQNINTGISENNLLKNLEFTQVGNNLIVKYTGSLKDDVKISIYNLKGQLIISKKLTKNESSFYIESSESLYLLVCESTLGTEVKKIRIIN